MSVKARLASERIAMRSQNAWLCIENSRQPCRAERQMFVVHTCEIPADVTGFSNELPFVGFLVRRL